MDVLLAILCIFALVLLMLGKREGFPATSCGNMGVASRINDSMRVYTPEECSALGGRFYDSGEAGIPGYGVCTSPTAIHMSDISTDCAYLNTQSAPAPPSAPAAAPMPPPMPAPAAAPMPAPMPPPAPMPAPAPAPAPAPVAVSTTAPLPQAMPTPTGGNTITSLPIPGIPSVAPQAASVLTSTPVGAPLGSGMPHGILLTMV